MSLIFGLVVVVLIAGFLFWLIQFLPVAEPFISIAKGLIVLCVVLYVLAVLFGYSPPFRLAR